MELETLFDLLSRVHQARILVLGDVMLDRFVYGSVERISPEAPIPVMSVDHSEDMPGGAGNVVRNCAMLGAQSTLISVVGNDEWAADLKIQLDSLPTIESRLVTDHSRPTTVKTRYVADRQQILRADRESREALSAAVAADVLAEFDAALPESDIVVLSDYAKGVLSDEVTQGAIARARKAGKKVIVDPKSRTFHKYAGAALLTPNRHELQLACGHECVTDEQVASGARQILDEGGWEAMVVTRGAAGMSVIRSDGSAVHLPTLAQEVFDVSGAGDTALAALAVGAACGSDIIDTSRLANHAAGIVVGKIGTAVVTPEEIIASFESAASSSSAKLFSLHRVLNQVQQWRFRGLKVAFTNGCFDLLHPGHVSLLEQARGSADKLVVGLNADASVRRLKGDGRPVQSESARATVLSSLKSVDAVVIFPEDTPYELIKAIEPDVLVKGSDYSVESVVGADLVLARGGKVLLADLVDGQSTTNTLKRVASAEKS